jgi:hypothetical protein
MIRQLELESRIDVYSFGRDRFVWETTLQRFANLLLGEVGKVIDPAEREKVREHFKDKE